MYAAPNVLEATLKGALLLFFVLASASFDGNPHCKDSKIYPLESHPRGGSPSLVLNFLSNISHKIKTTVLTMTTAPPPRLPVVVLFIVFNILWLYDTS